MMLLIETDFTTIRSETATQPRRAWGRANLEGLSNSLQANNWGREFGGRSMEESWHFFKATVEDAIEKHVPCTQARAQNRPSWMTQEILRSIRKKRRLWKQYQKRRTMKNCSNTSQRKRVSARPS